MDAGWLCGWWDVRILCIDADFRGIMMRTTLTIDDQLLENLKGAALRAGKPLKQVVNEALRLGLENLDKPAARPYRIEPVSMGPPRADIDLDKALQLADALENDAIGQKLAQRRCF